MLICLEAFLDRPLIDYFDWIGATSTGCYIMSTMMTGGSLRKAQRYYLMFKDQLFDSWTRPYDTKTLETFIQRAFGADRLMGDIKYPRCVNFQQKYVDFGNRRLKIPKFISIQN